MSKLDQLQNLYEDYRRNNAGKEIVFGDGNPDAPILLIGEAPGRDEVKQLKPFVGMAGKNLAEFLDILQLKRENLYITNAIKFRLSKINPSTGQTVNRPAARAEIDDNREYLVKEIEIIEPQIIVTLGNVPLKAVVTDKEMAIGQVHGELHHVKILDKEYKLFPLYHPASIIYKKELKEVYLSDIRKLKEII